MFFASYLDRKSDLAPTQSSAGSPPQINKNDVKTVAASACSGINPSTAQYFSDIDALHCRMPWNDIQLGHGSGNYSAATSSTQLRMSDFDFSSLDNWIRSNYSYGKYSIPSIMFRGDYYYQCATYNDYQEMPKFLLSDSNYNPIPGNRYMASKGDDQGESECELGPHFVWDIPYKQVNYLDGEVKNAISNLVLALKVHLKETDLDGTGKKLIDAVPDIEISIGHQGEARPISKNVHSDFPFPLLSCDQYNPATPEKYSDYCHYIQNGYNGDTWTNWQKWLLQKYSEVFSGTEVDLYYIHSGALDSATEAGQVVPYALSLGIGLKSTGLSGVLGPGSGKEYATWGTGPNGFTFANWWSIHRMYWDNSGDTNIIHEHGTSAEPAFHRLATQIHPFGYYWLLLTSLSMHADQVQYLSNHFEPARGDSTWNLGVSSTYTNWAKKYLGVNISSSPGAFVILRENALLSHENITNAQWHDPSQVSSMLAKEQGSGGCYYCDMGNYNFFMTGNDGKSGNNGQNLPKWNFPSAYSNLWNPVNGIPNSAIAKEDFAYRETDIINGYDRFCFNIEDAYRSKFASNFNLAINITLKTNSRNLALLYDTNKQQAIAVNSSNWTKVSLNLGSVEFRNSISGNDFCIVNNDRTNNLALHMVEVLPESATATTSTPATSASSSSLQQQCTMYDLNSDGAVQILGDFTKFLESFATTNENLLGDFNDDKKVDIFDFVMFRNALLRYSITRSCELSVLDQDFVP